MAGGGGDASLVSNWRRWKLSAGTESGKKEPGRFEAKRCAEQGAVGARTPRRHVREVGANRSGSAGR